MLISLEKSYYYLSKDNIIECQRIVHPMFFLSQIFGYCKSDNFLLEKQILHMEKKKKLFPSFSLKKTSHNSGKKLTQKEPLAYVYMDSESR
jgi:hypothetical protein